MLPYPADSEASPPPPRVRGRRENYFAPDPRDRFGRYSEASPPPPRVRGRRENYFAPDPRDRFGRYSEASSPPPRVRTPDPRDDSPPQSKPVYFELPREKDFDSALIVAAKAGDVEWLLHQDSDLPDINESDRYLSAALHYAAERGSIEFVRLLIDKSADPNVKDSWGRTPLFNAVKLHSATARREIVGLLLGANIDASSADNHGVTALEVALVADNIDMDIVSQLVKVDAQALIRIVSDCKRGFDRSHHRVDQTLKLINAKADVDVRRSDATGDTPLIIAAKAGCLAVVEALISNGADVELVTTDEEEKGPLHCAVVAGWEDCVKYLVNLGKAKLEATSRGRTPLLIAADSGKEDLVRFLLAKKADITALSNSGYTATELACINGHDKVAEVILNHMTEDQIIDSYITVHGTDSRPLIWVAAKYGCTRVAQCLIKIINDRNLPKNFLSEQRRGLHKENEEPECAIGYEAVRTNNPAMAKLLLNHSASFEGTDSKGNGVVHHIARNGFDEILGDLLDIETMKLQIKERNADGKRPVELAIEGDYEKVVKLLLKSEYPGRSEPPLADFDTTKWATLHWIAYYGELDLARLSTDPKNLKNPLVDDPLGAGRLAFEIAEKYHSKNIELLECMRPSEVVKHGPDPSAINLIRPKAPESAVSVCRHIPGNILDVYQEGYIRARGHSLYDVIYQYGPQRIMSAIKNAQNVQGSLKFRWIHLPANNVSVSKPYFRIQV
ncbi:Ankyrin repeat and death domain-containing protein 1A [Orbilia javanica]|uniref:Ankyrin repeat and death domain-containing protein 1A n=1 Tax=Orbilia javanica TaxID=47235 RepID=A0AAN8MT35_9PEZI